MIHVIRKMIKVSINFRVFIILRYYILFTIYYLSYHSANLFRIFSRQFPQMSHDLELQTSWTISNLLQNTSLRKSLVYRNNWIKIFIINSTIKILLYFKLIKFETQINSSQNISRSIFFYKKKKKVIRMLWQTFPFHVVKLWRKKNSFENRNITYHLNYWILK